MLGVSDNGFVSQYWYDAAGERTVKESFDNEGVYVNGVLSGARTGTSKFTAYVSPYMVVSQGGNYTKHIYMGSQRITSKVSNSGIFAASPVNIAELKPKLTQQTTLIKERFDSLGVKYSGVQQSGGLVSASPVTTADKYFYHPDHLGSSSLITNQLGNLVQHIQYVPFGEVFVEERNATWSTPYKFNGKEQDEETGLCYYGARYYDPRTSVWLSVDPLAGMYPNVSSYVYCLNDPVNRIDPDGRWTPETRSTSYGQDMYRAESGDNATTMSEQLGIPIDQAISTFNNINNWEFGCLNEEGISNVENQRIQIPENIDISESPKLLWYRAQHIFDEGTGDPANLGTITEKGAKQALGIIGAMTSLVGIGELVAVGAAAATRFILPALGLLNNIDDISIDNSGNTIMQRKASTETQRKYVNITKVGVNILNVGNSLWELPETLNSVPSSAGLILDTYSIGGALNNKVKNK